jgi:hypothetical protein
MKKRALAVNVLLFCLFQLVHAGGLDTTAFKNHLFVLGSDSLQGRGTGSDGAGWAATYIATQLKNYSLVPAGTDNGYYQYIPMHGSTALPQSRLILYSQNNADTLLLDRDYLLYSAGAETFIPDPAELVFAGYGIIAPEYDYNDYQDIDVADRIVVFLSGEPESGDPDYFAGTLPTIYSNPESKQRIAISRGARGSIIIPNPRVEQGRLWEFWQKEFAFETVNLAYTVSTNLAILMNLQVAGKLFAGSTRSLLDIFEMDNRGEMRSFPLDLTLTFEGRFAEREFTGKNVLGYLPGRERETRKSCLILSAHYDHLGIGPAVAHDSIYNGVFDNAAGVSAVLELARMFSEAEEPPLRSLLFLFTTGEEKGLLGAKYYTENPVFPLYRSVANINVDGISLFDEVRNMIAVGGEFANFDHWLLPVLDSADVKLTTFGDDISEMERGVTRSDQYAFMLKGIPSVLLLEGGEYRNLSDADGYRLLFNWEHNFYHTPFDDLDQDMNYRAAQQHVNLLFRLIQDLANDRESPDWREGAPFRMVRLQSIAEQR